MIDDGILKLVFARDSIPDLTMEAYLSSLPGVIGAIGFQRIAESHADVAKRARDAAAQLRSLSDEHTEVMEAGARIFHQIEPDGAVSKEQISAMVTALRAVAAKPVGDREPLFHKHDGEEEHEG